MAIPNILFWYHLKASPYVYIHKPLRYRTSVDVQSSGRKQPSMAPITHYIEDKCFWACVWFMPIIPVTEEAEIGRIMV
jgi:hypothetical protein